MAVPPTRRYRRLAAVLAAACAGAAINAATGIAVAAAPNESQAGALDKPHVAALDKPHVAALDKPHVAALDKPHVAARLTSKQRAVLRDATRRFRDVGRAVTAGYRPTRDCVPGMGYHYVKPRLAGDLNIDPTLPDILVYAPVAGASPRLAALEYFRADADGKIRTAGDRPTLFGHPFDGPMAGHPVPHGQPPMPVHYDLHVWLYLSNPSGELTSQNPRVRCG